MIHYFENTIDPGKLTSNDVARWCEELANFIRKNPDKPKLWLANGNRLQARIAAVCILASAIED